MRIVVIGPIFPFRGGIAHFNRILCESLAKNHSVTAISFSRLYPQILFPGKSQKESSLDPLFAVPTEYILDSINPLSWAKAVQRIRQLKPDWVVFQWWHTGFMPCYWTIARSLKKSGVPLSVVCHNFLPHDQKGLLHPFHSFFGKQFFRQADCLVAFSEKVASEIRGQFPEKKVGWILEPTYDQALENNPAVSREKARQKTGVSGNVLLFFGFVRPYKGLHVLLEALPKVLEKIPVTLLVAGEFWQDKENYLREIREKGIQKNVCVVDQYISPSEVQYYFKAANAAVFPYLSSTNSAALKMAFGFETPAIATLVGGNDELIEEGKTGLLASPGNAPELAEAIIRFFEGGLEKEMQKNMREQKKKFEWTPEKEKILFNKCSQER